MSKFILTFFTALFGVLVFIVIRGFQLDGFYKDPFVISFFSLVAGIIISIVINLIIKWKKN